MPTMFDRVGGEEFFEQVTRRFYDQVAGDEVLRPLYPEDDRELELARVHLKLFLIQFWGGPDDYRTERGEPRLRMRHAPFRIGQAERDVWVRHMTAAVKSMSLSELDEMQMLGYLSKAATAMINTE
jgi:hemoglobin